jgi:FtsZ-binding cell division protein ZapB
MTDTKPDPTVTDPGAEEKEEQDGNPGGSGAGSDTPGADQGGSDDNEDEDPPSTEAYKKLEAKARRREDALRKAQAELKELKAKDSDTPEVSAEDRANQKLVRASAKTVLAGIGVTDRADQASILEIIRLDDIEVDDSGDPDEDEISDRVERLRKALGVKASKERRTPARQTSDRGGNGGNSDPDSARYRAFLQQ